MSNQALFCTPDDFQRLERKVDDLTKAIVGNPSIGHKGLVTRIDALETYQISLASERVAEKSARRTAIVIAGSVATFVGAIGGIAASVIKNIISAGG